MGLGIGLCGYLQLARLNAEPTTLFRSLSRRIRDERKPMGNGVAFVAVSQFRSPARRDHRADSDLADQQG
jgi:hypothetical protein